VSYLYHRKSRYNKANINIGKYLVQRNYRVRWHMERINKDHQLKKHVTLVDSFLTCD